MRSRYALAIAAAFLCFAPAARGGIFVSGSYGDLEQVNDGWGSGDDFNSYPKPPGFEEWMNTAAIGPDLPYYTPPYQHPPDFRWIRLMDNPSGVKDVSTPFLITGMPAFDAATIQGGDLRFDFFYNFQAGGRLDFWNELDNNDAASLSFSDAVRQRLMATGSDYTQWLSIDIDLMDGDVELFKLNPDGSWKRGYGSLGTFNSLATVGNLQAVIQLAADGNLYGALNRDQTLSFISFEATSDPSVGSPVDLPEPALASVAGLLGLAGLRRGRRSDAGGCLNKFRPRRGR